MELRSIDAVEFVVLDKSELIAEVELMAFTCFSEGASLWVHITYSRA
jgi:hypothetical protein